MKLLWVFLGSGLLSSRLGSCAPPSQAPTATTTSTSASSIIPVAQPTLGGYRLMSCWTEGAGIRALSSASFAYDNMTLESCMSNCSKYQFFGTEYGRECYCGNWLDRSSHAAPASDCNYPCGGNAAEICGAGNRLIVYSTTASLTVTQAPTPTVKPAIAKYTYQACWGEPFRARALTGLSSVSDTMTLEECATKCADYPYFGTEYGRECYCGIIPGLGSFWAPPNECNMPCAGDGGELCGGSSRLSLYFSPTAPRGPANPAKIGTSTYYGCQTEGIGVRALSSATLVNGSMTLEMCSSFCKGFKYWGTEYGQECYCGNTLNFGSIGAGAGDCNMPCVGNGAEYCGAGNRLSVYVN